MWLGVDPNNGHQNNIICFEEIRLRAQNLLTILGSIVNIIGGALYDHLKRKKIFALMINKIFI